MAVNGISESALVKKATEGDVAQVPIGQTVITNTPELNSPNARLENEGAPIETIHLDQFNSYGRESLHVNRDEDANTVKFDVAKSPNAGRVVEMSFDKEAGALNIVKQNQEVIKVEGFLTQGDFGVGPTGPRGPRGIDGDDAWDGDDAPETGNEGCKGGTGVEGEIGLAGVDGEDGDLGPEGPPGPVGPEGEPGPVGMQGQDGNEGSRGYRGDSCSTGEAGEAGTEGQALNTSAVISSAEPDNLSVVWGIPT